MVAEIQIFSAKVSSLASKRESRFFKMGKAKIWIFLQKSKIINKWDLLRALGILEKADPGPAHQ